MEEQPQHRTTTSAKLRFVLGSKTMDVALPVDVPLVELLPAVLPQFGAERVEEGADHEGWVVQRVGEAPFDEDRTLAELNLLDGEMVHFRPRADQFAAIDYDDLVDGVGEQVREHPGAWDPAKTRWLLRAASSVLLLTGVVVLPGAGPVAVQAALAGLVAVVLLGAAAMVARGVARPRSATVLAGTACGYAAVCGDLLVRVVSADPAATARLTSASAAVLLALTVGLVAVADSGLLFAGAFLFTAVMGATGLAGSLFPVDAYEAVAIGLTLSLVASAFVPSIAFRLSGLTLPMLPTGAGELSDDIEPVPHKVIVERGAATVSYSTSLHVGLGLAQALLLPFLVASGHVWAMVLALVMALLLVLRSRHPSVLVPRWAHVVPAGAAVVASLVHVAAGQPALNRIVLLFVPVLVAGLLALLAAERLAGRRLRPYWGRAVEVLETVTAIAVVPILLQVLGVYATMRGLAG
ncbi:type VII secretion integral membrane protein EccD [Lentzea sp. NPDC059081]|uniref:type VII secretion integral membrane protein EccD n=1 Tax=Lentzea sp. NPDC059081 TaxID=3346719 RepID=UPI0036B4A77B